MRRKFYELADSSPVAAGVLRRIALLYAIEDEVRGSSAQQRQTARADRLKLADSGPTALGSRCWKTDNGSGLHRDHQSPTKETFAAPNEQARSCPSFTGWTGPLGCSPRGQHSVKLQFAPIG